MTCLAHYFKTFSVVFLLLKDKNLYILLYIYIMLNLKINFVLSKLTRVQVNVRICDSNSDNSS